MVSRLEFFTFETMRLLIVTREIEKIEDLARSTACEMQTRQSRKRPSDLSVW